jgi:anti-anti-sigma factor
MFDPRGLTFMGTEGLHAFIAARERAEASGRRLRLLGAQPRVRRVFELTSTESLLDDMDETKPSKKK